MNKIDKKKFEREIQIIAKSVMRQIRFEAMQAWFLN